MSAIRYREDIDGLRAIAVISVILFHLDINLFKGGFTGVDIFFVISGFLISGLIVKEVQNTSNFNFRRFYIRRIRRLFPALFATILVTTLLSILLFSAEHLKRTGGEIIHALTGVSNIYFWTEANYFDTASETKPLLHTWSLAVEEQFYLLWPITLYIILKTRNNWIRVLLIGIISIISLLLNPLFQNGNNDFINSSPAFIKSLFDNGDATIFYLLPFRVFEFTIGGLLVFFNEPRNQKQNRS